MSLGVLELEYSYECTEHKMVIGNNVNNISRKERM